LHLSSEGFGRKRFLRSCQGRITGLSRMAWRVFDAAAGGAKSGQLFARTTFRPGKNICVVAHNLLTSSPLWQSKRVGTISDQGL
jgi:hypothetical protein